MAHRLGLNEKKSNTHWLGILCYNEPMKRILTATLAFILSLSIFASVDWSGEYLWVNPTSKDNKGKCKELHFKVICPSEGCCEIFSIIDGQSYRMFPIISESQMNVSFDWDSDTEQGISYRKNAEVFNTTSFKPDRWKVTDVAIGESEYSVKVQTEVAFFKVSTFTRYSFVIEDGKRKLKYTLGGDGLAKTGLFRNPVPQNGDKLTFVLTEI
ncbi:MAG: hypothetical protein PHI83_09195 [Sphaerochaetaceae bacterium]|nr:hypothetical protein [Sphaerochaetaceae bacterium]